MRIVREKTAAIFIDYQERLIPAIHEGDRVVARSAMLLEGLKVMDVPAIFPRQYPKGLGDIVPELRQIAGDYTPFDKLAYSAVKDEAIAAEVSRLGDHGVSSVIVTGVEAHVCVLQTCIDLKGMGFQPVLVTDCIGSRFPEDKKIALKRAVQEGVLLTTAEAILFELCLVAGTPEFKAISKLVK